MKTTPLEDAKKILNEQLNCHIADINRPEYSDANTLARISQALALIEITEYLNAILYVLQNRLNQ